MIYCIPEPYLLVFSLLSRGGMLIFLLVQVFPLNPKHQTLNPKGPKP